MRVIDADELLKQIDEWLSWDIKLQGEKPPVTIPNKWLKGIKAVVNHKCDTINAIIIPENATNGDMIKSMFSSTSFVEVEYVPIVRMCVDDYYVDFNKEWWNAPYKRG